MSYHAKALFREEHNIKAFCKRFGIGRGQTFFFTMTFKDNITDKKEAVKYWNILRTQISKIFPLFRYICVWERQDRGAWHLHALCNCPSLGSMLKFKKALRLILGNSNTPIGFFQSKWTHGTSRSIGNYMYKYLTKQHREKCVRYVNYSRNFIRFCGSKFSFIGGRAGVWRASCRVLDEMFPVTFKFFHKHARFDYLLSCVNSLDGDAKTFFKGLENMFLYFDKVNFSNYRHIFCMQLYGYMNECRSTYENLYPYGQLKFNLKSEV